jgi:hypothetical protein
MFSSSPYRMAGAYGIIIKRGVLTNGGCPYIGMFRSLHVERPDLEQVVRDEVVLAGWTVDALVCHGRWIVVGHRIEGIELLSRPAYTGESYAGFIGAEYRFSACKDSRPAERGGIH